VPWPSTPEALAAEQARLAALAPEPWTPPARPLRVGACAVVFGRGGGEGLAWAAAVVVEAGAIVGSCTHSARVDAPFRTGQLALREGPVLERAVRGLAPWPDLLLVAGAGRDHPRRAGLAVHLGAVLDVPTVGVTDRPLLAAGAEPAPAAGSRAPLRLAREEVGQLVRARRGAKPVVAHAGWRTSAEVAADIVLGCCGAARWPEPLRAARRLARELRAAGHAPSR
jgi:deoxyribonuclease V